MKRLAIALAIAGLSTTVFAALPAATDPTLVNIPQLPGGIVIGGSGYYLQPSTSNGDLDYAAINNTNGSNTFTSSLRSIDPGYDWGWGVNVGYIFPNTGNDVNLSYLHFDTNDNDAVNHPDGITTISSTINTVFADGFNDATATVNYDLDQVDLTVGQYLDVGCRLSLHPYAGLRWAQLERKLNSNYTQSDSATGTIGGLISLTAVVNHNAAINEKSDFEGIGPIIGDDISYYLGGGFGVIGHADAALLIGNIDSSVNLFNSGNRVINFNPPIIPPQRVSGSATFSANADATRQIVPVLDGKLGLDYTFVFNNTANSDLTLEAGYQASEYFNSINRLHGTLNGTVIGSGISFSSAIQGQTTSNMGLNGPYVNLSLHI